MAPASLTARCVVWGLAGLAGAVAPPVAAADTAPPTIVHAKVLQAPRDRPIELRVLFEDDSAIFAPSVYYRRHGENRYQNVELTEVDGVWVATIPAQAVTGPLEYFVEAFDEQGNGPAREGDPTNPIPIAVYNEGLPPTLPPPAPPPPALGPPPPALPPPTATEGGGLASKWWFWTAIGVAVTGGIATAVLLTRSGPVDAVDVVIVGPDPAASVP